MKEEIRGLVWSNNDNHPTEKVRKIFNTSIMPECSQLTLKQNEDNLSLSIVAVDNESLPHRLFVLLCREFIKENIRFKLTFESYDEN